MFPAMLIGDVDVAKHWTRMTSLDDGLKSDLKDLIDGLKSADLWGKIDILCVVHDNEHDSLLNLKGAKTGAPDSVAVNTPSFTNDRGFWSSTTGPKYISLGVTETSANLYDQHDAHVFAYVRSENDWALEPTIFSLNDGADGTFAFLSEANGFRARIQHTGVLSVDPGVGNRKGFIGISVTADDKRYMRVNDSTDDYTTPVTHTLGTDTGVIGADIGLADVGIEQYSAWGIGSGLSPAELASYEDLIRVYLLARGASVY